MGELSRLDPTHQYQLQSSGVVPLKQEPVLEVLGVNFSTETQSGVSFASSWVTLQRNVSRSCNPLDIHASSATRWVTPQRNADYVPPTRWRTEQPQWLTKIRLKQKLTTLVTVPNYPK